MAQLDLEGRFLACNRRLRGLLGVESFATLEHGTLEDFAEAEATARLQEQLRALMAGECECAAVPCGLIGRKGGRTAVTLRLSLVVTPGGKPLGFSLVAEEESGVGASGADYGTRQWKERCEMALRTARLVVYERDASSHRLLMSESVQAMLGHSPLTGGWPAWMALVHPEDRLAVERQHLSALPGEPYHHEYRVFRADGRVAVVREEGCLVADTVDPTNRRRRLVALLSDISDQRDLALKLQHAQKMEVFGRLAGGVAHDFNNLLTVFSGYTDMLVAELEPQDPRHEYLEEMQRAAERATALTSQLLAFGRMQRSQPALVHLGEVLTDLRKMLRRLIGEDIELVTNVAEGLGMVRADPRQIETVLINLAVNARDAMPHGGRLSIEIANALVRPGDRRTRAGWQPGPYVQMTVADTGIGMSAELCERVFEPFFTTKAPGEGTGLGLATCYGIVEQSGGRIGVESTPGQGSLFRIYLPRVRAEAAAHARREAVSRGADNVPRGKGETILLVEDDLAVQKIYSTMLRRLGYNVLCGSNGDEALRIAGQHPEIGLVITDLVMPFMSGIDLAEELRHTSPNAKVVLISGYASEPENLNSARRIPFLAKPLSRDTLACTLRELLETA